MFTIVVFVERADELLLPYCCCSGLILKTDARQTAISCIIKSRKKDVFQWIHVPILPSKNTVFTTEDAASSLMFYKAATFDKSCFCVRSNRTSSLDWDAMFHPHCVKVVSSAARMAADDRNF